ncbi:HWE histidine kinase domain-containing protein [Sabulicella glaciei]|uniref:histidine kinase n=1 Tax=Sabulicella glaciei TaxID=2984948 RepID=A0ABT3P1H4_9PROT|nr:HWE histidine kinase domain-containing protein [Roseococcus sp. MDT2-1-1]MCW8088258.1 PAS domain-containing protein [Roseococcus sp. MDT2-1-1]
MTLEDLYRMLRSGHVQAKGVVDNLDLPLVVLDQDLRVTAANPAFLDAFGVERDDTIGQRLFALGDGQWDIPELRLLLADVVPKAAAVIDYKVTHDFPGIGRRTMLVGARRMAPPGGHGRDMLVTFEDVTERGRLEAEKDVLLAETHHRMRNLLAVVRALAVQTRAAGRTGEEYRDALLDRLEALARAQDASLAGGTAADLADVVRSALEPIGAERARIEPGPAVQLATAQVMPLGLILHELVTNALKHGALSVPGGAVRVNWRVTLREDGARRLLLHWREQGGPPVEPPAKRGFGTRLIEFSAGADLGGEAKLCFESEGLHAEISVPLT